jgi:DNA-directed RNA polymerase subunit RPC12/RpoP
MLEKFLYLCPKCETVDALNTAKNGEIACKNCGTRFYFDDNYDLVMEKDGTSETKSLNQVYLSIRGKGLGESKTGDIDLADGETLLAVSDTAELFQEMPAKMFRGYKTISALLFKFEKIDTGKLYLTNRRIVFIGEKVTDIDLAELTSATIESHMVITNTRRGYAYSYEFLNESGKKWEDFIREALTKLYRDKTIDEFQPRITFLPQT